MSAVLAALLWALAALGLLLAAALVLALLPVELALAGATSPAPRLRVTARALAGRAPRVTLWDSTRPRRPRRRTPAPPEDAPRARRTRRARAGGARAARVLRALPGLLAGLLAAVEIRGLRLSGRFGLDDPAETGALYGRLCPVLWPLAGLPGVEARLAPDFSGPVLELDGEARLRLRPVRLLPPALRFGWRAFGPAREGAR